MTFKIKKKCLKLEKHIIFRNSHNFFLNPGYVTANKEFFKVGLTGRDKNQYAYRDLWVLMIQILFAM